MRDWPPIHDPHVLEWLSLDDEAWHAVLKQRQRAFGPRPYDAAALQHALGYPWERPAGSYILRDGEVHQLEKMRPSDRRGSVR